MVKMRIAGAKDLSAELAGSASSYLSVVEAPSRVSRDLNVTVGFVDTNRVFLGDDRTNELVLSITNPLDGPLVPGGSATWGELVPCFELKLVAGEGRGALSDSENLAKVAVVPHHPYGNHWKSEPVLVGGDGTEGTRESEQVASKTRSWRLEPDRDLSGDVLGHHENATVTFKLSNIVTNSTAGITLAYLCWHHIPGYDNGHVAIEIEKVDPIRISRFELAPSPVPFSGAPAAVTLDFEVVNATHVTITNAGYAARTREGEWRDSVTAHISSDTTFTLVATNEKSGQQEARSVPVVLDPLPVVIHELKANPPRLSSGKATITLDFVVEGATFVSIIGTDYAKAVPATRFHDWVGVEVGAPTTFTLVASNPVTGGQDAWPLDVPVFPDAAGVRVISGTVWFKPDGSMQPIAAGAPFTVAKKKQPITVPQIDNTLPSLGDKVQVKTFEVETNVFVISFPPGSFPENGAVATTVLPIGSAALPVELGGAVGGDGSFVFEVVLTTTIPNLTPVAKSFTFLAAQSTYPSPSVPAARVGLVASATSAPTRDPLIFAATVDATRGVVAIYDVTDPAALTCHGHAGLGGDGLVEIPNVLTFPEGRRTVIARYGGSGARLAADSPPLTLVVSQEGVAVEQSSAPAAPEVSPEVRAEIWRRGRGRA
jgi:hypothetical protein